MASLLTPAIGQGTGRFAFSCKAKGAQLVVENVSCGSLEECWETQSFQRALQLFRCEKWVKIPGKLQLSSARAQRLVRPESAAAAPASSRHHGFKPCRPRLRAWAKGERARSLHERALARSTRKYLVASNPDTAQNLKHPGGLCFLSERDPTRVRSIQGARAGDLRVSARPRASRYGNGSRLPGHHA
jgi:hypothetical protein